MNRSEKIIEDLELDYVKTRIERDFHHRNSLTLEKIVIFETLIIIGFIIEKFL